MDRDSRRLIFYRDDIDRINHILADYNKLSGAKCQVLFDKEGHPITCVGAQDGFDINTLGAVVAGSFAATRAMARILGEREFALLSRQNDRDHLQLTLVADRCMLITIFHEAAAVGIIRLHGQEAARKLADIFRELAERVDGRIDGWDDLGGAGVFARLRPRPLGPGGEHAVPPPPEQPEE